MITFFSNPLLALAVGGCLIASCSPSAPRTAMPTEAAPRRAFDTFTPPNVQLPGPATGGTCPNTVDLWARAWAMRAEQTIRWWWVFP